MQLLLIISSKPQVQNQIVLNIILLYFIDLNKQNEKKEICLILPVVFMNLLLIVGQRPTLILLELFEGPGSLIDERRHFYFTVWLKISYIIFFYNLTK